ncbi:MAG: hypothetical protein KatS3mg099_318 [Candidatus Parcubacteria bacterium]|nr:MAG: hypothetical protein KatS3mg099_318 [Candidatus Parcubacteria bacterium]
MTDETGTGALVFANSPTLSNPAITTALRLPDGTASAPALTFTNDTDTGLYRGGTDILRLVTAGQDRVTIDASGNIGIGTTNPQYKLQVDSNTVSNNYGASPKIQVANGDIYIKSDSTTATRQVIVDAMNVTGSAVGLGVNPNYVGTLSYSPFEIRTNNQTRMTITNTGNIGDSRVPTPTQLRRYHARRTVTQAPRLGVMPRAAPSLELLSSARSLAGPPTRQQMPPACCVAARGLPCGDRR